MISFLPTKIVCANLQLRLNNLKMISYFNEGVILNLYQDVLDLILKLTIFNALSAYYHFTTSFIYFDMR